MRGIDLDVSRGLARQGGSPPPRLQWWHTQAVAGGPELLGGTAVAVGCWIEAARSGALKAVETLHKLSGGLLGTDPGENLVFD